MIDNNSEEKETILLKEYIKREGSFEQAARNIGVNGRTLRRVLNGEHKPSRLLVVRLKAMGIEVF